LKHAVLIFILFVAFYSKAQNPFELRVQHTSEHIVIDGKLDESSWKTADSSHNFWQNFPYDTSFSKSKTTVKVLANKHFFYLAAICYDDMPDKNYVITSLKRDFDYDFSDAFSVYIDPYNDQSNGFSFSSNPLGVQAEGLIQSGGGFGVSTDWDNKWFCESSLESHAYIIEMAIPFKTIRYNLKDSVWRINFSRNNLKTNENSTWKPVPRNMNASTLVNCGHLIFDVPPQKQKLNAAFIPYAISNINQNNSQVNDYKIKSNLGMDAKIVLTPSLNLDLTVNPDFAQVDVDRQVINLTRFSVFFPERRNFFLENSDLFASFGFSKIRPFFSRRIGLERGVNIPIPFGARMSGKIGQNWRVGVMSISTSNYTFDDSSIYVGQNYSVAAFQRRIFGSSNIGGIFVNQMDNKNFANFSRIAGLDYNLQSKNGKWLGKAFWHQSFSPNNDKQNFANATWLLYTDKKIRWMWNHEYVHKNYNARTGFVPRTQFYDMRDDKVYQLSYYRLEPEFIYRIFPKSKRINNIKTGLYSSLYLNDDFSMNDGVVNASVALNFQNSAILSTSYSELQTQLMFITDVLGNGTDTFYKGYYNYRNIDLGYQSNIRRPFNYSLYVLTGGFFNGKRSNFNATMNLRIQPKIVLGLRSNVDYITLPALRPNLEERKRTLTLIAPSFEWSFTKKIFFTTYIQYNSQSDNINIYSRFQYRFRPMSDLFVVYGDNYSSTWYAVNRGLTIKLVMWLNS
jgi:hypothetical protein